MLDVLIASKIVGGLQTGIGLKMGFNIVESAGNALRTPTAKAVTAIKERAHVYVHTTRERWQEEGTPVERVILTAQELAMDRRERQVQRQAETENMAAGAEPPPIPQTTT